MLNITLKQLELFVAVADCSSFTLAAEQQFMTQSTVSIHIAALENALGVSLFDRVNRKKISLTPSGRIVYAYAKEILRNCSEMTEAVSQNEPDKLRIGASSVPAQYMLPNIMAGFIAESNNCSFVLRKGDSTAVHEYLRSGIVRIGFVGAKLDRTNMDYIPLMEDILIVITPNNEHFRQLYDKGISGDRLLNEPIIVREADSGSRKEFERYLIRSGSSADSLNIVAEIDQTSTIIESVSKGVGISVISAIAAQHAIEDGYILPFKLGSGLKRSIYLTTLKGFVPEGAETEFIAFVSNAYAG